MSENGKSYRAALAKVDRNQRYLLEDSLRLVKDTARAKFDETVEMAIRLGVDPRQADQNIRGTVTLPHGMGKPVRVLAFAKGEIGRAHVCSSHEWISYAVFCLKKKTGSATTRGFEEIRYQSTRTITSPDTYS